MDLEKGDLVRSRFAIVNAQQSSGKNPHKFTLRDRSGDIGAKAWPSTPGVSWEEVALADYADVTGKVEYSDYTKGLEIKVDTFANVADPGDLADFLPTTPADREELWNGVKGLVKSLADPYLGKLMRNLFKDPTFQQAYRTAPAAQHMHHPYIGGLLEHSFEVASLCDALAITLGDVDRDLLVVAALLHDIGKIEEIDYASPHFGPTRTGGMLGHVFLGAQRIYSTLGQIKGCPDGLPDMLCHLLLSHQGKLEWGAPVAPCTHEAAVLHLCDHLSAQGFYYRQARQGTVAGSLFKRVKGLEGHVFTGEPSWRTYAAPTPADEREEAVQNAAPHLRMVGGTHEPALVFLPLLGRIAAGVPTDAQANLEGRFAVPQTGKVQEGDFLLRVSGDSMIDAHILDGDVVHVRPTAEAAHGAIVVALSDGESTVKYLIKEEGTAFLRAANPAYGDIVPSQELQVQGIVVGVLRGFC